MAKIIIFGAGKNGEVISEMLGHENILFCDNYKAERIKNNTDNKLIITFDELKNYYSDNEMVEVILSTGIVEMRLQLINARIVFYDYMILEERKAFFVKETIKTIINEKLLKDYYSCGEWVGNITKHENWYRDNYYDCEGLEKVEINKKLIGAMKAGRNNEIDKILGDIYDDNNIMFDDECFENRPGMQLIKNILDETYEDPIYVCDMACGHGDFLKNLQSQKIRCYGVEFSKARCELCIKEGIECKCGGVQKTDFKDDMFDVVTMMECLEHVSDTFKALNEAYRVLKSGGRLFVTVPYGTCNDSVTHVRNFYEDDLFSVAKLAGFGNIKIFRLPYLYWNNKDNLILEAIK